MKRRGLLGILVGALLAFSTSAAFADREGWWDDNRWDRSDWRSRNIRDGSRQAPGRGHHYGWQRGFHWGRANNDWRYYGNWNNGHRWNKHSLKRWNKHWKHH